MSEGSDSKEIVLHIDKSQARAREMAAKKLEFLKHLEDVRGIKSAAAHRTGVHRDTVYGWLGKDPVFAEAVREICENFSVDYAESKLLEMIEGVSVFTKDGVVYERPPDTKAILAFLEARTKGRGYGQSGKNALNSGDSTSANGRDAKLVTMDQRFVGNDGFSLTAIEFLDAIEAVTTTEELKTVHDVFIRARKHIESTRPASGGDAASSVGNSPERGEQGGGDSGKA